MAPSGMSSTTAPRVQSKMDTATWTALFPTKLASKTDSLKLTKKLMSLALSSITYLKLDYEEDCYVNVKLDNMNLKILDPKADKVKDLCRWIKGAADAINRGYLSKMTLAFFTERGVQEEACQLYSLQFEYAANGETLITMGGDGEDTPVEVTSTKGKNKLYSATKKMLRWTLQATQATPDLPEESFLTLRLFYTDSTPEEYEPPGFKRCEKGEFELDADEEGQKSVSVRTPWHGVGVEMKARRLAQEEAMSQMGSDMASSQVPATQEQIPATQEQIPATQEQIPATQEQMEEESQEETRIGDPVTQEETPLPLVSPVFTQIQGGAKKKSPKKKLNIRKRLGEDAAPDQVHAGGDSNNNPESVPLPPTKSKRVKMSYIDHSAIGT